MILVVNAIAGTELAQKLRICLVMTVDGNPTLGG